MSNKLPKPPKRYGKLSQKAMEYQDRRNVESNSHPLYKNKASVLNRATSVMDTAFREGRFSPDDLVEAPSSPEDSVKIFLDDDRSCPSGWMLARNSKEFYELINRDNEFLNRVTDISLDWYLGECDVTGIEVARELAYKFFEAHYKGDEPKFFLPNLQTISFHSSDKEQAFRMRAKISDVLKEIEKDRPGRIHMRIGHPIC